MMGSRGFLRRSHRTVDQWLEKIGFYRKCIARDETCLFRIVSEQLYHTQTLHSRVREEVLTYMETHRDELSACIENNSYDEYMDRLRNHLIVCGNLEISIVSLLYNRDVVLFEPEEMKIKNVTDRNLEEKFLLCRTTDDHYDGIFRLDYIEAAGFCQSMVYEMLYEKVFNVKDTSIIVDLMLHYDSDKAIIETVNNNSGESGERLEVVKNILNARNLEYNENTSDSLRNVVNDGIAPFSFKVAKALDPTIYRNIAFDSWNEIRKEIRYNQWYKGGDGLTEGVRCIVKLTLNDSETSRFMTCYIQKIAEQCKNGQFDGDEPCVVYIEDLAQICTVRRDQLEPLPHAVAWPMPLKTYKNLYKEASNNSKYEKTLRKRTPKPLKACKFLDFTSPDQKPKSKSKSKKELISSLNSFNSPENVEYIAMPAFITNQFPHVYQSTPEAWSDQTDVQTSPRSSTTYTAEYTPTRNTTTTASSYVLVDSNDYQNNRVVPSGHMHPHLVPVSGHYEPVNYHVQRSNLTNGSDLPFHDVPTLRFFFNMGLDYFRSTAVMWSDYHQGGDSHMVQAPVTPAINGPSPMMNNSTPIWQPPPPVMVPHIDRQRLTIDMQQLSLNDDGNKAGEQDNKNKKLETGAKTTQFNSNVRNNKTQVLKYTPQPTSKFNNRNDAPATPYVQSHEPIPQSMDFIPTHPGGYFTAHYIPDHPPGIVYGSPEIIPPFMYPNCFPTNTFAYTPETLPIPPPLYNTHPHPQTSTK